MCIEINKNIKIKKMKKSNSTSEKAIEKIFDIPYIGIDICGNYDNEGFIDIDSVEEFNGRNVKEFRAKWGRKGRGIGYVKNEF